MAGTQDMNKFFENFMASFPMDTYIFEDGVEKQSAISKKYYYFGLGVAEKSNTVSYKWATETIAKMQEAPRYDGDPSTYAKSIGDFVSERADVATENFAAYAEIAKKAQMDLSLIHI